jgi:serine/threonine-protein kinase
LPEGPYANLTVAGPLAVAPGGALYVADPARHQVLVRLPNGRFRVVAGDGKKGVAGDGGPAIDAEFLDIVDMAVGTDGSLYVVDGDRIRVVSPSGVISTVAGVPGVRTPPPCCSGIALPPPIANGTPARSVSIDQLNSAAIAVSEQDVLYISTGLQLFRLVAGKLDIIATRAIDPPYDGQPLPNLGQIAVDSQDDVIVSGGNGWAIWQVAPDGVATEVSAPNARRSGGNTSVLERAPDGLVYGESGSTFLKVQGHRATPAYSFPQTEHSYFWLTYFAFGPDGTMYADEVPGSEGFEKYQQLRAVRDDRSSVLWQQTSADLVPAAS